jgi:hypothetical protein
MLRSRGDLPDCRHARSAPRLDPSPVARSPRHAAAMGHAHIARDAVSPRRRLRNGHAETASGAAGSPPATAARQVRLAVASEAVAARRAHQPDARSESRWNASCGLRSRSPARSERPADHGRGPPGIARTRPRVVRHDDDARLAAMGVSPHRLPPAAVRRVSNGREGAGHRGTVEI